MTRTTTDRATTTAVVAGVDTHKDTHHVAVLATSTGARLGDLKVPATPAGYEQLLGFVASFGTTVLIGVEGTNSYGAGLARYLTGNGVTIREVIRPKRAQRRRGKSDPIDAYAAAQQALAEPDTLPIAKTSDGPVEQIRVLMAVRRSAMKARVAAHRQIASLLITAPDTVRTRFAHLDSDGLIDTLAATRPGPATDTVTTATGQAVRRLARRHQNLTAEIAEIDAELRVLTTQSAPAMLATKGFGVITTATLLTTAGDTPTGSTQKRPSPRSAASPPSPPAPGKRPGTASTAAATGKATGPCTRSHSCDCPPTHAPRPTPPNSPPQARPKRTFSAASNERSPAKPGTYSSTPHPSREPTTSDPYDTCADSPSPRPLSTSAPSPHASANSNAAPARTSVSRTPTANTSTPLDTNRSIGPTH